MNFLDLFSNKMAMSALSGWVIAQLIKTIIDASMNNWNLTAERLVGAGGMPSSHSSTVCALATSAAMIYGFGSSEFAISGIMAIIVMYDARGVRQETGKQAIIINKIMAYFTNNSSEGLTFDNKQLKELIGHTPLQVLAGGLLGIFIGFLYTKYI